MEDVPSNFSEAKRVGAAHYFTGKPCKNGHVAKRTARNGVCVACMAEATKNWMARQVPGKGASYQAAYRDRNREAVREKDRTRQKLLRQLNPRPKRVRVVKNKLNLDRFVVRARAVHGERYDYLGPYQGMHFKTVIRCGVHGEFRQTPQSHLKGTNCPDCSHHQSKYEDRIVEWAMERGLRCERWSRDIISPREIDIWFPDQRLGVEVHGLYWHTEDRVGDVHEIKYDLAQKVGIRLIQLFQDEIADKWSAVEGRLSSLLGISPRVGGRETMVVRPEAPTVRSFLTEHHLQGAGSMSGLYYGLQLGDDLVAVMCFGPLRSGSLKVQGSADEYELVRFSATKTVVGGFTKLLQAFIVDRKPSKIVSFSDMCHSNGNVYRKNGFALCGETRGQYWWVPRGYTQRVSRHHTQKHKIKKHPILGKFYREDWSETDICRAAGWSRILGVGNQRWELTL